MSLTISRLAKQVNDAAPRHAIGGLQRLRAELHQRRQATSKIFSTATVMDPWFAFHHGGRTELQFNIGREEGVGGNWWWRHGVAFSFERSQTLPDPILLLPKVERFNEWIREHVKKLRSFRMWHFDGEGRSKDYGAGEISRDLVRPGVFVFLGRRVRENEVNIDGILRDFDALLELYEYIESMTEAPPTSLVVRDESDAENYNAYVPSEGDYRATIERQIRERRGQPAFRKKLRKNYGDKCLVTGCEIFQLVEAAHIRPYRGENDNNVENGLLLRADIHTLFDLDLLGIEPDHLCVELSAELAKDVEYTMLAEQCLKCDGHARPSHTALKQRYEQFKERRKGK